LSLHPYVIRKDFSSNSVLARNGNDCYGTAVTAQRQVTTATAQRNFSRKQRNSFGAYEILTEFAYNGSGETATEWWKPGVSYMYFYLQPL